MLSSDTESVQLPPHKYPGELSNIVSLAGGSGSGRARAIIVDDEFPQHAA